MAQVELAITFLMESEDVERMRKAFARRFKNPALTLDQMLGGLKQQAAAQIRNVIVEEERAAIEEQKAAVQPPAIG